MEHRLGRGHGDDDVRLEKRAVQARTLVTHGRERLVLRVVDDDAAAKAPRLRTREEAFEVPLSEPPPEAARDEDRLPLVRNPAALELRDGLRDRGLAGLLGRAGKREGGGLDEDRRRPAGRRELVEPRAGERKAQRVAHRRGDVHDLARSRRRA